MPDCRLCTVFMEDEDKPCDSPICNLCIRQEQDRDDYVERDWYDYTEEDDVAEEE